MASSIPFIQLNSGNQMPVLGFGTATFSSSRDQEKEAVIQAIERGYRHFDTAAVYGSEEAVGEAIAEALSRGLIQSRRDLFVTSKLWCSDAHADRVLPALQKTLKNLKMEYLDLYLIHWPVSVKAGDYEYPTKKENVVPFDCNSVWAAMEECQKLGLVRSIGVSNFTCKKIQDILPFTKITPAVNQVELNPCWQQKKLIDLCKGNGIVVTSFSPLGAVGTSWGSNRVVDNEVLNQIAKAKAGKSVPQVCLRWAYQQGVAIVVKSFNTQRMQENRKIFDWELSEEECRKISEIPQSRNHLGEEFIAEDGPNKSIQQFWDGEI